MDYGARAGARAGAGAGAGAAILSEPEPGQNGTAPQHCLWLCTFRQLNFGTEWLIVFCVLACLRIHNTLSHFRVDYVATVNSCHRVQRRPAFFGASERDLTGQRFELSV